ncbi:hypothetical protein RB5403 [Rhodopirellula baltica SH 1]|uniref:Uncharacterized protein n=1 Tax=Rhodopirellula baltica (strain DSM 10527 / NCIMB 13988 / SH1) TaxID=243090 RepID=Q7URX4_RHOBA|nr:hypothetical protein RB5403 [Rhodopirellula baltica SH 1]
MSGRRRPVIPAGQVAVLRWSGDSAAISRLRLDDKPTTQPTRSGWFLPLID